jgi:hypothetical protein
VGGKKSQNCPCSHCAQNVRQTAAANCSCTFSRVNNKQEYNSKIKDYKIKQDNSWNNLKSMSKKQSKQIEKEIKDTEALHLELAVALSKETAKEESEFNPYENYADYYKTQLSQLEIKEDQNRNETKINKNLNFLF